ncbi:hypothetical protein DRW41_09590 [Neobacillus piezotolerans]|uniref:Uncharacterized protein n=1 Tax=Neobacillus piezotolerans TaxID=2259171 RepID=A0A3D8GR31_9BACI|nr:hypothetical protein DRW41_09590 [Neobacillus piezotolerans]
MVNIFTVKTVCPRGRRFFAVGGYFGQKRQFNNESQDIRCGCLYRLWIWTKEGENMGPVSKSGVDLDKERGKHGTGVQIRGGFGQ